MKANAIFITVFKHLPQTTVIFWNPKILIAQKCYQIEVKACSYYNNKHLPVTTDFLKMSPSVVKCLRIRCLVKKPYCNSVSHRKIQCYEVIFTISRIMSTNNLLVLFVYGRETLKEHVIIFGGNVGRNV